MFEYAYPRPAVTADLVLLNIVRETLGDGRFSATRVYVLLIQRGTGPDEPFPGMWALPGGFANEGETIEETAIREMFEETDVKINPLDLIELGVYSKPGRDPRGWTMTNAFVVQVPTKVPFKAKDDAAHAEWVQVDGYFLLERANGETFNQMAFDHYEILIDAVSKLVPYDHRACGAGGGDED